MRSPLLTLVVEDRPGVLLRIAACIARRGVNIRSLRAQPTSGGRSIVIIELENSQAAALPLAAQLDKLVHVVEVLPTAGPHP